MEHMSQWADSHPLDFSKVPGFTMPTSGGTSGNSDGWSIVKGNK
jgi:hypothetical protein